MRRSGALAFLSPAQEASGELSELGLAQSPVYISVVLPQERLLSSLALDPRIDPGLWFTRCSFGLVSSQPDRTQCTSKCTQYIYCPCTIELLIFFSLLQLSILK